MYNVQSRAVPLLLALLLAFVSLPRAAASFSSIYTFGDGVCSTTGNSSPGYYGNRYCNGKVWIEVLSNWQGVDYVATENVSYFGHDSTSLKSSVNAFSAPADAATSLFIVWCNDADFVEISGLIPTPYSFYPSNWTYYRNLSVANYTAAITTLYDKGARLIVAPNAVDIMRTPFYNFLASTDRAYVRSQVMAYNTEFEAAMADLMTSKPGLKILCPDTFTFFDQVISNPASFGLVNPYPYNSGLLDSGSTGLNGPGASFVFWDDYHPTAKFQMFLADFIQQVVSPVTVNSVSMAAGMVQMQLANVPFDRAGSVQGSANLSPPWSTALSIDESFVSGGSTTKDYSFPSSGGECFYRAGFPVVWTWP